jgi:hypothetical protein
MDEHQSGTAGGEQQTRTGIASVDAVLDQVSGLEERPVAEHVGAFERAHEQLRRALDADPEA